MSKNEVSETIASASPRTHTTGGFGSGTAGIASARLNQRGDIALRTPRVPGAVPGQCGDGVESPG